MSRAAIFVVLALAGAVAAGVFLARSAPDSREDVNPPPALDASERESSSEPAGRGEPTARRSPPIATSTAAVTPAPPSNDEPREPLGEFPGLAIVRDPSDTPLHGVEVSWTSLAHESPGSPATYEALESARGSATTRLVSSAEGRVDHRDAARLLDRPALVWASQPGRLAAFEARRGGEATARLELEAAPAVRVRVLDALGALVAGATVVQRGRIPWPPGSDQDHLDVATALYERVSNTDEEGVALACAHPGRTLLRANLAELASPEVELGGQEEIELRLAPTFSAAGRVVWPAGHDPASGARVVVYEFDEGRLEVSTVAGVRLDGSWESQAIALSGAPEFAFKLEARGLVPLQEVRPAPAPGERVLLELRPQSGSALEVLVQETLTDGVIVGLEGAQVSIGWLEGADWVWNQARTGASGHARLEGLPPGDASVHVARAGYVAFQQQPIRLPAPEGAVFDLILERAGRITGRCTFEGEPVADFDLVYWRSPYGSKNHQRVHGGADGRFEIESAPVGPTLLLATSEVLPEGEPVALEVRPDIANEVELQLSAPTTGRGRIVDAYTGEPIAGAWVAPIAAFGRTMLTERGTRTTVGAAGDFLLENLPPRDCRILAGAPGYHDQVAMAAATDAAELEFGRIELARPQRLSVIFDGAGEHAPERFVFQADGPGLSLPYMRFPAEGVLELEDVHPGDYTCWIFPDDAPPISWTTRLTPGRNWILSVPLAGARPLEVELVPSESVPLPVGGSISVGFDDADGNRRFHSAFVEDSERYVFPYVNGAVVDLLVSDASTTPIVARRVRLTDEDSRLVRVELGGHDLTVRVVDLQDRPVLGAVVVVAAGAGDESAWDYSEASDHRGEVQIGPPLGGDIRIAAWHPLHGIALGEVRVPAESGATVDLALGKGREVELRLLDGAKAAAGVLVELCPFHTARPLVMVRSDDRGRVRLPRLTTGEYLLLLHRLGIWTAAERLRLGEAGGPVDVQVRGVGDLELSVLDEDGAAVTGAQVELRPLELEGDVRGWLRAGWIEASSHALRTDAQGLLTLRGLPRGAYACRVEGLEGEETLQVASGATLRHELRLR